VSTQAQHAHADSTLDVGTRLTYPRDVCTSNAAICSGSDVGGVFAAARTLAYQEEGEGGGHAEIPWLCLPSGGSSSSLPPAYDDAAAQLLPPTQSPTLSWWSAADDAAAVSCSDAAPDHDGKAEDAGVAAATVIMNSLRADRNDRTGVEGKRGAPSGAAGAGGYEAEVASTAAQGPLLLTRF
jgi:hypothetical protein